MKYYAEKMAEKRKNLLLTQFRDFLYSLSASFASGRHMRDGLMEARENLKLTYDEKSPMIMEISDLLIKIDESRASEEEVLKDCARRSHLSDIQSFIDTYFICRMTGGDMNQVISKTSGMLIEKIGIEKEIKTLTAQKSFEGKIISIMPVLVILFLNLVSPEYIEALYTSFMGRVIMTTALAGIVYSWYLTGKLMRIEV
jgi:tight adherence protein B